MPVVAIKPRSEASSLRKQKTTVATKPKFMSEQEKEEEDGVEDQLELSAGGL